MGKGERMEGIVSGSLIRLNDITISYDARLALPFAFIR